MPTDKAIKALQAEAGLGEAKAKKVEKKAPAKK